MSLSDYIPGIQFAGAGSNKPDPSTWTSSISVVEQPVLVITDPMAYVWFVVAILAGISVVFSLAFAVVYLKSLIEERREKSSIGRHHRN